MPSELRAIESILDAGHDALDDGQANEAERAATEALRRLSRRRDPTALDLTNEAEMLAAWACADQFRDDEALERVRRVLQRTPDHADAMVLEARLQLLRWELDEAESLFARIDAPAPLQADVVYHRAILAELRGGDAEADALYAEAHRLDPKGYALPVRVSDAEAQAMLAELVQSFPDDVRGALDNVRIDLVGVPDPRIDRGPDADPMVLGLYHGVPITEKAEAASALPPTVRIFKRNIERLALDQDHLREQLRITLLHEVGHHLGWDEDDLEERGLA